MVMNLRIGLAIVILIAIVVVISSIKNKKLQLSFSIFTIIIGILMVIALLIPSLLDAIAGFLGFEVTSNMLFLVAIFIILYLIFRLMVIISSEYKKNVKLVQEISILKAKVEELEKKIDETK